MLLDEWAAIARERPSLPLGRGGDNTAAQEAMAQPCGKPGGLLDIGFAARHRLDGLGIDSQERLLACEPIVAWAPVHAGAFHGPMGAPLLLEPVGPGQQGGGQRPTGPGLLHGLPPLGTENTTGDHGFCVHVEAPAPRI